MPGDLKATLAEFARRLLAREALGDDMLYLLGVLGGVELFIFLREIARVLAAVALAALVGLGGFFGHA